MCFYSSPIGLEAYTLLLESLGTVANSCLRVLFVIPTYCITGLTAVFVYVKHTELLAHEMSADLVEISHYNEAVGHW